MEKCVYVNMQNVRVCTCMQYVSIYSCIFICICVCVYVYISIYACMYTCINGGKPEMEH